jgi:exocyst complex component 4
VLVLQQNLKNVEVGEGAELGRAGRYFELFEGGPEAVVERARVEGEVARRRVVEGEGEGGEGGAGGRDVGDGFTYDELKTLLELWYSEQLADPERGVAAAAKRQLADKLLGLSEVMWQS